MLPKYDPGSIRNQEGWCSLRGNLPRHAGGWKGLVDAKKLIRDIYKSRLDASRSEAMTARYRIAWILHGRCIMRM